MHRILDVLCCSVQQGICITDSSFVSNVVIILEISVLFCVRAFSIYCGVDTTIFLDIDW